MPEMPTLPIWDILNLNGITDVVGEYLSAILQEVRQEPEGQDLPFMDPYAEI
jgi:hypothetical protein